MTRPPAASRPRPLAATVALAVVVAVGLTYLLGHALGPWRPIGGRASFGRPSEDNADGTAAAEGSALEEATAVEEPVAEPRRLRSFLVWAIYLTLIVVAVLLGPRVMGWALGSEYPMATVSGGSMWPALNKGDIILLKGVSGVDELEVGDIIALRHQDGMAIHRIVEIEGEEITTKGDANFRDDPPISIDNVIGKVPTIGGRLARIPYLGHLARLLGPVVGTATEDAGQPAQTATEGAGP